MAQLEFRAHGAKESGDVTITVIAHHPVDDDPPGRKPSQGAAEKGGMVGASWSGKIST